MTPTLNALLLPKPKLNTDPGEGSSERAMSVNICHRLLLVLHEKWPLKL